MVASTVTVLFLSAFAGFEYNPPFGYIYTLSSEQEAIEFNISERQEIGILIFIPTVLIGLACGLLGALFTFLNLKVLRFRRKHIAPHKWRRIVEPLLIMLLVAIATVFIATGFGCTPASSSRAGACSPAPDAFT